MTKRFDIETPQDCTIIPNFHQQDKRISLDAKGLLSQIFALSDWTGTLKELASFNMVDSIETIQSAVNELVKAGYLVCAPEYDALGCVCGYKYTVCPKPHTAS